MNTKILAGMFLLLAGNLFAGDYIIDGFCRGKRSNPQTSNAIITVANEGNLPKTTIDTKLKPGELIMRLGFGEDEYCLYKGNRTKTMEQQNLFVFPIPKGMSRSQILALKYYTFAQIDKDPSSDIRENVYFDNSNIYVLLYSTIYWMENEQVRTCNGIKISDPKAKPMLVGNLDISYTPADADVFIDEVKQTIANPGKFSLFNLVPGEYLVSVHKTGYQTNGLPVLVKPRSEEIIKQVSIVLLSAYGTVVINSEPAGMQAKIYPVKKGPPPSAEWGSTPLTLTVEPGEYVVQMRSADELYLPAKDTVITVQKNDTTSLSEKMIPDFGSLSIMSSPPGAAIAIDGKNYGPAPITNPRFKAGTYTVMATLVMRKTTTESVTVGRGGNEVRTLTLKPDFGTLMLKKIDPEFEYMVDGQPVPAGQRDIATGQHLIEFDGKWKYKSMSLTIDVKAEDRIPLGQECVRLTGGILINTTPPTAEVFVDDQKKGIGVTPVPNFPTGPHTVSAKKTGYKFVSVPVFVKEGEDTLINLVLPQIPDRDGDDVEDDKDPCPDEYGTANGCRSTETMDFLVNSDPLEATISENQKSLGITPTRLTLFEGKHSILFSHVGYKDTVIELDARQESSRKISIQLQPTAEMFKQITAERQAKRDSIFIAKSHQKKASMRTRQIIFGGLGAILAGAGYYFNTQYDKSYNEYLAKKDPNVADSEWKAADDNRKYRDWLYIGAGVLGSLFTISFFF